MSKFNFMQWTFQSTRHDHAQGACMLLELKYNINFCKTLIPMDYT